MDLQLTFDLQWPDLERLAIGLFGYPINYTDTMLQYLIEQNPFPNYEAVCRNNCQ